MKSVERTTSPAVSTASNATPENHQSTLNIPTTGSVGVVRATTSVGGSTVSSVVSLNRGLSRRLVRDRRREMVPGIVTGEYTSLCLCENIYYLRGHVEKGSRVWACFLTF